MIPKKFENLDILVLLAGPGSGSKLFQGYLDGHSQILMTPGYILMYFYPHWDKHLVKEKNWKVILNKFLKLHPSILDTSKMKGGDFLYNLGNKKKDKITISKKKFISKVLNFLSGEEINSKNFFLAIHLAYAKCIGENLSKKKILVYHMHVCWYLKKFCKDFGNIKIISMVRELKSNIPNRVVTLENPNLIHLNPTDQIFFKTRSYKNIIFEDFYSLDFLKKFDKCEHRVIKHEDLLIRKYSVLKNLCKYIDIRFENILKKSTANKIQWNYKHAKNTKLKDGVATHITKYNANNFFRHELHWINYLSLTFNQKYKYNYNKKGFLFLNYFLTFLFIFFPSKTELKLFLNFFKLNFIVNFFKKLCLETNTKKLIFYENNAFYFHKWSNKYYPFKIINFLLKKKKNSNLFWISIYFLFKTLLFFAFPALIIFEYISRILICYGVLAKILFRKRFFPIKL